jgi:flagellin
MIDSALRRVSQQRADLGAYQNRFETAQQGVAIASENLAASESQIRDVNMASEIVDYTRNQILTQSNNAMLAQANTQSQSVLQLLG